MSAGSGTRHPAPDADVLLRGSSRTGRLLPGPVLFARYAYPPNALGYCGPADPTGLLQMASEEPDGSELTDPARLVPQFEGAWPYLQLISRCAGIKDPLDPRVVEAYWTGNELLSEVPPGVLAEWLGNRSEPGVGRRFAPVGATVTGGVPQHNLHVFAVYPWLGLLRAGKLGTPLEVLDRCRIRWGLVEAVDGDLVTVRSRGLQFEGGMLTVGQERSEQTRRGAGGSAWISDLQPGDRVSLHWDWVCDRLSGSAYGWLRHCTERNLEAVNSPPRLLPPNLGSKSPSELGAR